MAMITDFSFNKTYYSLEKAKDLNCVVQSNTFNKLMVGFVCAHIIYNRMETSSLDGRRVNANEI